MAHIYDLHNKSYVSAGGKIALYKLSPTELFDLADLGVAVSGQVYEVEISRVKKVYGRCLAGLGADTRQRLSVA